MIIVVDSSIAVSWGLPDEDSPVAREALYRSTDGQLAAPGHFWHEVSNVFLISERRNRLTPPMTQAGLNLVAGTNVQIHQEPRNSEVLGLARRHALTTYDAAYLELALRLGATLATLDRKLARAAVAEGVEVISD